MNTARGTSPMQSVTGAKPRPAAVPALVAVPAFALPAVLVLAFALACALAATPFAAQAADAGALAAKRGATLLAQAAGQGAAPAVAQVGRDADVVTLNFRDAEIESVIAAFGHLLGRTFVIDPRVRGQITLATPRPVTRAQAYELLQTQLRLQGIAVVESSPRLARVIPEADAKLQPSPVGTVRVPGQGEEVLTQIFTLSYESASNLVPVLRPLISPNNTIAAFPNNNSLIITDYASNLQRLARIIASLDTPSHKEVEVITVRHALASDIAVVVSRMLDDTSRASAGAQVDAGQRISILAEPRTNAIMLRSSSASKMNLAKSLIARLDQPSAQPGNVHVVYLRNAEAVRLAEVLREVLSGRGGRSAGAGTGASATGPASLTASGRFSAPATGGLGAQAGTDTAGGGQLAAAGSNLTVPDAIEAPGATIAADPATNSLIITAPEPVYRDLRAVIDKLDARRAQVYIESLIVELSAERAAEIGVQWQLLSGIDESVSGTRAFGGTNLPARGTGSNILDLIANPIATGQGLNIGVVRGTLTFNGSTILNIGLLARALESQGNANILATPNLLTLDNEEARIIIGQNVPFITGQFTTASSGATVSPFQTIERQDVGTTLRVRPQVSEGGTVKLQIFQEVSSVIDSSLQAGLVTNRRAIESNVLVDDGQIVVLGGLIEERLEDGTQKVPGLGDIPVVGNLFRYDSRKRIKTNLLVFLRPVIVRTPQAAYDVTVDRYDYMRRQQDAARLKPHWALPDFQGPSLPDMPAPPAGQGTAAGEVPGAAGAGAVVPGAVPPGPVQTAPNEIYVPIRPRAAPAPADAGPGPAERFASPGPAAAPAASSGGRDPGYLF